MNDISPKYLMELVQKVHNALWAEYKSYNDVKRYVSKWYYEECNGFYNEGNFTIYYKDKEQKNIDVMPTLDSMDGDLLLKMAIDLGVETPDFIPAIPTFRNEIKSSYERASGTFEKAFKCIESDPATAVGLANAALESIIKEILKDNRIKESWKPNQTLYDLCQVVLKAFKLYPHKEMLIEIKTISASLLAIGKSIETLRSDKTEFHGKMSDEYILDDPIYTYLCVNAISTVGLFFIKYYKKIYCQPEANYTDGLDLPF